ncbi:hypothetical protein [Spiroplasma endosymbiont of Nomada rufipes]|uniref:hypothetical protein n=2 Tax=unclassified Spiroplasma TaxID=2637901 RepID=UPI00376F0C3B
MADKTNLQTFHQIIKQQRINDILNKSEIAIKARHGGLTIRFEKNKKNINNTEFTSSFNSSQISQTKIIENGSQKYRYNSVTILDLDKQIAKKIIIEEARAHRILNLQKENNDETLKIEFELKKAKENLEKIKNAIVSGQLFGKKTLKKRKRELAKYEHEIKEKTTRLRKLKQRKEQLNEYQKINSNIQNELKNDIKQFLNNDEKNKTKILTKNRKKIKKLKIKLNKINILQKELKYENKILKLENEIKQEKIENGKKVKQIYEEILTINNNCYYITTFIHNNQSISEKIMFFHNFDNDNIQILTQTKQYKNLSQYQNDLLLINNNNNFDRIPIKEFIKEQTECKEKPSIAEFTIWGVISVLSVGVPILISCLPFVRREIATELKDKLIVGLISITLGLFIKTAATTVSTAIKKVDSWIYNKMFKNQEKIEKDKKEFKTIIRDLTSDKVETQLERQFNILKQELDNRKKQKINKLLSNKITWENPDKAKSTVTNPVAKNFDLSVIVNSSDIQPPISPVTKQRSYSI